MAPRSYATAPLPSSAMPPGVPYIVGNEAAERFSFYGMRAILTVYMVKFLLSWDGEPDTMTPEEAKTWYHAFVAGVYFLPLFGALLADAFWGKYRTILYLSIVYCLGHLALAVVPGREGLALGLLLIVLGSGGIKSCVSANVGDQFGQSNQHLLEKVFGWFYFAINFGSFFSTILTPRLLELYGPHVAFGVPGILMLLATIIFWMGRYRYVHIPPAGWRFVREMFSREGLWALARLSVIYLFVMVFWSLYDQTGSAWVLQADQMDLHLFGPAEVQAWLRPVLGSLVEREVLSSEVQAVNPLLIMLMIPLFSYVIYPLANRFVAVKALWKVSAGLFLMVVAFALSAIIESWIQSGARPSIWWQILAYVILTAAEVMVSITCLEFSYTQAPKTMKSLVMGLYLLSISAGNLFTSVVNAFIERADGTSRLPGASYYWFFTAAMLLAALAFVVVAALYRERTYIQDEAA